jgi:hypothetical protein
MVKENLEYEELYPLTGFENNVEKYDEKSSFNFIFSNGSRSTGRDKGYEYETHMMSEGAHKSIRSARIYYKLSCI